MKNGSRIPACVMLMLAVAIAVGSQSFLGACVHADGSFGACHWASRALLGEGCLLGMVALLALLVRPQATRLGAYLSALPVCALGILTPGTLIDICRAPAMTCRALMRPAMIILFAAALACAGIGALMSARR